MKIESLTTYVATVVATFWFTVSAWAGGVISVNIADGDKGLVSTEGVYGLAPARGDTWVNVMDNPGDTSFQVEVPAESRAGAVVPLTGVSFEFASSGGFGRYKPDGVTVDTTAPYLSRYIDDSAGQITISAKNIPYKAYMLYIYLQADYGANLGGWEGGDFQPIQVNGTWYGYSEAAGRTVACGERDYWGSYGLGVAQIGVNALAIPMQYGKDLTFTIPSRRRRSCLCAFQIVESDLPVEVVAGAISVNFGAGYKSVAASGALGALAGELLLAQSWNNISGASGAESPLKVWDGETLSTIAADAANAPMLTWSSSGTYYDSTATDAFLYGYLDDNSSPTATVSGIPWKNYDVIVYLAADWNSSAWEGDFNAVKVNDKYYTWSSSAAAVTAVDSVRNYWGAFGQGLAALGVNAIRISGLTGSVCTIETGLRHHRGGFAAFQIVKPDSVEITLAGDTDTKEINRLANGHRVVYLTLPAGSTITLAKNVPLACDRLIVLSGGNVKIATWNAIAPQDEKDVRKIESGMEQGALFYGWRPTRRAISLNFYSERGEMSGVGLDGSLAGDIPAASWNNISGDAMNGSVAPIVWNGTTLAYAIDNSISVEWTHSGCYGWGSSPNRFMRGWLNASGAGHWTLKVTGIPFERYDVIVYFNWDGSGTFHPLKMNGTFWTWDAASERAVGGTWADKWGASAHSAAAEFGVNALRIVDQTSPTIDIWGEGYNNAAAIQIVEYCPPPREKTPGLTVIVR